LAVQYISPPILVLGLGADLSPRDAIGKPARIEHSRRVSILDRRSGSVVSFLIIVMGDEGDGVMKRISDRHVVKLCR
jgi:hypothetical protein